MLYGASKQKMWAAGIVAALTAVFVAAVLMMRIKTTGAPWGPSARSGTTIATLIVTLEPYIPSLHRDPGNDRFEISLLLHDARDAGVRKQVTLVREQRASVLNLSYIQGATGRRIRYQVPEDGAYDLDTGRILTAAEVHADPVLSAPRTHAEILAALASGENALMQMLCAAGFVSETRFVAAVSAPEIESSYKPGLSIPRDFHVERSRDARRIHLGEAGQDGARRPLVQLAPASDEELLNAAFVRSGPNGAALELAGGDGLLLVYESKPLRAGVNMVARVDAEGRIAWRADTGIQEFIDILPDPETPAFVGTRPRVEGKVSEPILVIVDAASGATVTHSLWVE